MNPQWRQRISKVKFNNKFYLIEHKQTQFGLICYLRVPLPEWIWQVNLPDCSKIMTINDKKYLLLYGDTTIEVLGKWKTMLSALDKETFASTIQMVTNESQVESSDDYFEFAGCPQDDVLQ